MRLFLGILVMITTLAYSQTCNASRPDLTGIDINRFVKIYGTLPPTPQGEWHIGSMSNDQYVQIRYKLPGKRPVSYGMDFHNIVPLSGTGKTYQLQLRRDSPTGPLVYDGPACNCYFLASTNRSPLEIADWITDRDIKRGYLDIFASCRVEGDDTWTMYRDDTQGEHRFQNLVIEDTPELRKALSDAKLFKEKSIHLLPVPQKINPSDYDFTVTSKTRILISPDSAENRFSAELLRDAIYGVSGIKLSIIHTPEKTESSDIVMQVLSEGKNEDQSYRLDTAGKFRATAESSTGLFYAVQTAMQLLRMDGEKAVISGAQISDYPSLKNRMIQYDIARYQTVNIPYLKRLIREMSRFKLNQLMLYMEDDFKYSKYPFTGKPGTFTPESACELSEYGRKYHVEVIPQLEALGHGTALLSHPEFADLRENGNPWVFDTSNPRTWQVLDDMIGELTRAFNGTKYIHLGCDEFEEGFAKCPQCKMQVEKIGWGGLYAQHVTRLNELAKKYNRKMIIWAAHGGRGDVTDYDLTIKYADILPKDIAVMEWNYDPLPDYPTVPRLQQAGFSQVFVAPGVMGYAMINPDNGVSFGSVRNFNRFGVDKAVDGTCACTWELGYGSQLENHLYGLVYSGYCSWNTNAWSEDAFERAFSQHWFGLEKADPSAMRKLYHMERMKSGQAVQWANGSGAAWIFWAQLGDLKSEAGIHWPQIVAGSTDMLKSAGSMLKYADKLRSRVSSNKITLDAMMTTIHMYKCSAMKILAIEKITQLYRQARAVEKTDPEKARNILHDIRRIYISLADEYSIAVKDLEKARDERGASSDDVRNAAAILQSIREKAEIVDSILASKDLCVPDPDTAGL